MITQQAQARYAREGVPDNTCHASRWRQF